jgi:adenine-specific DNA-methyltransferase
MPDHWDISPIMHHEMAQIARLFRKEPTTSEATLWQVLRGRQFCGVKFRRQQPIGPFVVDFFAAAEKLIVEVDGPIHVEQREADRRRQELLQSLGLRFVRVGAHDVEQNLAEVLVQIGQALTLTPRPPLPYRERGR